MGAMNAAQEVLARRKVASRRTRPVRFLLGVVILFAGLHRKGATLLDFVNVAAIAYSALWVFVAANARWNAWVNARYSARTGVARASALLDEGESRRRIPDGADHPSRPRLLAT